MLKILITLVVLLLASILLVVLVGYTLPVEHVAARVIVLHQKPAEVFSLISNFKDEPSWRNDVQQVELLPDQDGHARFREKSAHSALTMLVLEAAPPLRMVTQIDGKNLPFGGRWIFEIIPDAAGCRLNITERGEIYNPVFRFVSRFFIGYTGTLNSYLSNVARKFGEAAIPTDGVPHNE